MEVLAEIFFILAGENSHIEKGVAGMEKVWEVGVGNNEQKGGCGW